MNLIHRESKKDKELQRPDDQVAMFVVQRSCLYLQRASEYFKTLVSGRWARERELIEIKYDCSPASFETVLRFIMKYGSTIPDEVCSSIRFSLR